MVSPPPSEVNESWNEFTAPVEVPVVEVANSADAGTPKRVSLPSIEAPARLGAVPWWVASATQTPATTTVHRTPMAARIA